MDKSVEVLVAMAGVALAVMAGFVIYGWRQRQRTSQVKAWVTDYLTRRDGGTPAYLSVYCTSDRLAPVRAFFNDARSGALHRLQFACGGPPSTYSLVEETVDGPAR